MTLEQIQDLWEHALRRAEREVDEAYAHSPHLAREFLERYFFLMRVSALQAQGAHVHSIGAAATLASKGFRPWTGAELQRMCERDFPSGQPHMDPPGGDGHLLQWIRAVVPESINRKEVLTRAHDLFAVTATGQDSGLRTLVNEEMSDMAKDGQAWYDEASSGGPGGFFRPAAGRNKVTLVDEPFYRENSFGRRNLDIPTNLGTFSTTQRTILSALADYAKRHRGKIKGATLIFTSNGAAGTAVRYEKVEVR